MPLTDVRGSGVKMDDIKTITINEVEYTLRQWPALPGWKFTRALTRMIADAYAGVTIQFSDLKKVVSGIDSKDEFKVDPAMIDKVMSDANFATALDMLAEGLNKADGSEFDEKERKAARAVLGRWSFPDFITTLIAVIRHNVSFLGGHVTALFDLMKTPSATSTPLALESRVSADVPSTKS